MQDCHATSDAFTQFSYMQGTADTRTCCIISGVMEDIICLIMSGLFFIISIACRIMAGSILAAKTTAMSGARGNGSCHSNSN
jgi:hypothetical protein